MRHSDSQTPQKFGLILPLSCRLEFKNAMHALGVRLQDEDYDLLFDEYDMDSSGEVWSSEKPSLAYFANCQSSTKLMKNSFPQIDRGEFSALVKRHLKIGEQITAPQTDSGAVLRSDSPFSPVSAISKSLSLCPCRILSIASTCACSCKYVAGVSQTRKKQRPGCQRRGCQRCCMRKTSLLTSLIRRD